VRGEKTNDEGGRAFVCRAEERESAFVLRKIAARRWSAMLQVISAVQGEEEDENTDALFEYGIVSTQ